MSLSKLNIQSVCSYFHIACTLVLFCAIPFFYSPFIQYGLIFFFVSFIADYLTSKRWQEGFKWNTSRVVSALILLQFVLLFIFGFFEKDTRYLSTFYEMRTAYLGFGIVGLLGVSDKFKVRPFAYASALTMVPFLIILYNMLPEWIANVDNIQDKVNFISQVRGKNICSHMTLNIFLSVGMILFSKVISISKSKLEKAFSILMILVFYVLVVTTMGRVGLLHASIVLLCIFLRFAATKLKYLIPTLVVLLVGAVGVGTFLLSDNSLKDDIKVLNKTNPREYIWHDGVELIKESPIVGLGASTNALRVKERLLANEELCSMEKFLIMNLKKEHVFGMHTHNQLMQSWQEYGIIGLVAILALFVAMILLVKGSLSLSLVSLVLFIQMVTEPIDGGITAIGFCTYIYFIQVLLKSKQVGKLQS
jgi:O-antigen ligase